MIRVEEWFSWYNSLSRTYFCYWNCDYLWYLCFCLLHKRGFLEDKCQQEGKSQLKLVKHKRKQRYVHMCNLKTFMSRIGLRNYQNQGTLIFPSFIICLYTRTLSLSLTHTHTHTHIHTSHPYLGFSPYFLTFLRSPVPKRKKCGHRQLWVYISTTLYPEGGKGSFAFFF